MHDITIEEEGKIEEDLQERGVLKEITKIRLRLLVSYGPRKIFGLIVGLVETHGNNKQQRNGYPRLPLQFAFEICKSIIYQEHVEQSDSEPIATFCRQMEIRHDCRPEVLVEDGRCQKEKDDSRDNLYT
jgi:hypothetical protein